MEYEKGAEGSMNEKIYKAMRFAGTANITVGIIVVVVGVAAGIISIVSGARLLKEKRGLTF
jgi:hypothetical protein